MDPIRIYRIAEVCNLTGLKPSTIYKLVREKAFPPSIPLTQRSTGWPSSSIDRWIESRINGSKNGS
ncbi:AlpA family phage regulatory protein [Polynucleobacter paneuropaeus]|nr:AlpA family phage regulatory protein [Polynucleobacter paneuropaeus]